MKLKEAGTDHWISSNGATNEAGFTALPAGALDGTINNGFQGLGHYAYFWSSTQSALNNQWAIE